MRKIEVSAYDLAERYVGVKEVSGPMSNPLVLAMLRLDETFPQADDVAWCSAFVNWVCWHLRLPRTKSLRARSWLGIGTTVEIDKAEVGFDVAILRRGTGEQPGADVLEAPGHVGFFGGYVGSGLTVLGGNQSDSVSLAAFPLARVLGIRRLLR